MSDKVSQIYSEACAIYKRAKVSLGDAALGYEVLYGPTTPNPEVFFVGYQPGGAEKPRNPSEECPTGPPLECNYAVAEYRLARRLQSAFGKDLLRGCSGANVIFLRAPSVGAYRKNVSPELRANLEELGKRAIYQFVSALRPHVVLFLGFNTMSTFMDASNVVLRSNDRALLSKGLSMGDVPAFGMRHPTGARPPPSDADLKRIADFVLARTQ